jgi:hypothetical protein
MWEEVTVPAVRSGEPVTSRIRFAAGDSYTVEVTVGDDLDLRREGSDMFEELASVRRDPESHDVILACNGSRRDVFPSPMLRRASGGRLLGVVAVLLSIWIATLAAGGQLSFTAGEVEYGFPPRRRSIAWTSIVSFATVSYRPPWYCLVINTTSGSIRVPNIAGSRTFVARVAAELEAAQRQLAAGPVSSDRRPPAG